MVELTERQTIAKLQQNEARLGQIKSQMDGIARTIEELRVTRATIEQMPKKPANGLLPLGGVLLPVTIKDEKIKVNIGAKVIIEQSREKAIETIKSREMILTDTLKRAQEAGGRISAESRQIQKKLEERHKPNVPVISG